MRTHRTITPSVLYFGTPVGVVSSANPDGTTNLAPISSYWAIGRLIVVGLGSTGRTLANLRERPELVLNLADETHWEIVEQLGRLTGADPVPAEKPAGTRFEPDKFGAMGWSALPASTVAPDRVAELPVHLEARVTSIHDEPGGFSVVHAVCAAVHVDEGLVVDDTSHIDPRRWRPLIYSFRHYFGLGQRQGIARRAELQE